MALLGVGLPVFDGERYLRETVESILGQSFGDFELVITDNASTDGTEEIARRLAAEDGRVRYVRQPRNLGPAVNFNEAFALSRGDYFKWAAADDVCAPTFFERCVEVLERDSGAVIAYPATQIIDDDGNDVEVYDLKLPTDSTDPVTRFEALLRGHKCYEIFGVIRRTALEGVPEMGRHAHGDGVMLARLGLRGRFEEIPEPLFRARRHGDQSMALLGDNKAYLRYTHWFDPATRGKFVFPYWRIAWEFRRSVLDADLSPDVHKACMEHVRAWVWKHRRFMRGDVAWAARRVLGKAREGE